MAEMKRNDLYLDSDGTLGISADVDISKVKRILLTQEGTHYGSMYYQDLPDTNVGDMKCSEMPNGSDAISRQAAIDAIDRLDIPEDMCVFEILSHIELEIGTLPSAQPEVRTQMSSADCISRQAAIDIVVFECDKWTGLAKEISKQLRQLPSAQPEPISEAYAKAVMTWLVQYQIKCAELQGRYTPYEVLGWIVNDWRKDNGIDGINQ